MAKSRSLPDLRARVLGAAHIARLVPHLAPETLHQIIQYAGLDACAELVVSATPEQLASVFDLDLWISAEPGRDERFDVARFGEWLELLVEAGDGTAARTVAALDEKLVIAGLSAHVRVFDPASFAPAVSLDGEWLERDTDTSGFTCEIGGYVVRARRADAWDAIVSLLLALDAQHHDAFHAILTGCRRLSSPGGEADGLDDLLLAPDQLLHDIALAREGRRTQQGYSTPADARAFLQMARRMSWLSPDLATSNPIAVAYLRAADNTAMSTTSAVEEDAPGPAPVPFADAGVRVAVGEIVDMLAEAGLVPERPRALLEAGAGDRRPRLTIIRRLMDYLRDNAGAAYEARGRELAFLANTMMAGCSVQARAFTPQEASDAVAATSNLGLEYWPDRWPGASDREGESSLEAVPPITFLEEHDVVTAFGVGLAVLHEEVSLFVAERLVAVVGEVTCSDRETQDGLDELGRQLVAQCRNGTPWLARDALDVLATLDVPAWAALLALLGECPVIPAALGAVLEGRTGAISATAFEFISTRDQLRPVRAFMARLPEILRR